jgi:hypothetical protein
MAELRKRAEFENRKNVFEVYDMQGWVPWLMLIIPATQEVETGRL